MKRYSITEKSSSLPQEKKTRIHFNFTSSEVLQKSNRRVQKLYNNKNPPLSSSSAAVAFPPSTA
jgi:hypothetical protein